MRTDCRSVRDHTEKSTFNRTRRRFSKTIRYSWLSEAVRTVFDGALITLNRRPFPTVSPDLPLVSSTSANVYISIPFESPFTSVHNPKRNKLFCVCCRFRFIISHVIIDESARVAPGPRHKAGDPFARSGHKFYRYATKKKTKKDRHLTTFPTSVYKLPRFGTPVWRRRFFFFGPRSLCVIFDHRTSDEPELGFPVRRVHKILPRRSTRDASTAGVT